MCFNLNTNQFIHLYGTALAIIIFPALAFLLLIFDNEPPEFPLPRYKTLIDCFAVSPIKFEGVDSRLNVSLSIGDFIQYPKETALQMINIITRNGGTLSLYEFKNFWDIEYDGDNVSFCVLHPFLGKVDATLACHTRVLAKINHTIEQFSAIPVGWSKTTFSIDEIAHFDRVCYSNGSIVYFAQPSTIITPMKVAFDRVMNFAYSNQHPDRFAAGSMKFSKNNNPFIFISSPEKSLWLQMIDVLIPIYSLIFNKKNRKEYEYVLVDNQTWLVDNIKYLLPKSPIYNETEMCFESVVFPKSIGSIPFQYNSTDINQTFGMALYDHFRWINTLNPKIMKHFRYFFTDKEIFTKKIVVAPDFEVFLENIHDEFPDYEVVLLPNTNSSIEIANILGDAQVFIAGYVSTTIFSIFLPPGATLIEIQPKGMECTQYGKIYATFSNVSYIPYYTLTTNCKCQKLRCYIESNINEIEANIYKINDLIRSTISQ